MNEVDIERWVDDAPTHQRGFREAVHIILDLSLIHISEPTRPY